MKRIILALALVVSIPLYAAPKIINCASPQGMRIDYFSQNAVNLKNNHFNMSRDRASGFKISLSIDTQTVFFNMQKLKDHTEMKATMPIILNTADQLSFAGVLNGAPILGTYYPEINVLIYSQQATWPGPDFKGARAVIFYAMCQV